MNKKITAAVVCLFILTLSSVSAIEINATSDLKDKEKVIETLNGINEDDQTLKDYIFLTLGPVKKQYIDVEIHEGKFIPKKIIERNLNRKLLRFSIFLPFILIPVEGFNFTVTYKKDTSLTNKYTYITYFGETVYDENGTLINVTNSTNYTCIKHSVKVENFTGFFMFFRMQIRILRAPIGRKIVPPQFVFLGFCDKVTEN